MTKTKILTKLQEEVLFSIFCDPWFRQNFYLTGGTALAAFYFQHRYSEDLDFFTHNIELSPVPKVMFDLEKKIQKPIEHIKTTPSYLRFLIDRELKIDVVVDVDFRVGSPKLINTYMVDTIKNLAVNKVCAILGRLDAKDYVDLYWILKETDLDIFELIKLAQKKDAGLEPFVWASLIASVRDLTTLPNMIQKISLKEIQDFFLNLRDKILDKIHPEK